MSVRVRCLLAALLVALGGLALSAPVTLLGPDPTTPVASSEAMVGAEASPIQAKVATAPRIERSAKFHTTARLLLVLAPLVSAVLAGLALRRRHEPDAAAPALIRARTATPRAPPALAV